MGLTPHDEALLDFERECWTRPGRKEDEIRAQFSISPSSYYRALHALIERSDAAAYDPLTVRRVRKRREQGRRSRIEGCTADPGR
jgi:Protein of unknown function (DUF3263)